MSVNEINLDNLDGNTAQKIGGAAGSIADQLSAQQRTTMELLKKLRATEQMALSKRIKDFEEMAQDYLDLKQRLREYPDMIKEQKENILGLEEYAEQASQELQVMEDMEMLQISNAVDEDGKKKYSNKESREAALNWWKSDDEEYQANKEKVKSANRDLENAKFDLDRIYNEYKSDQKIADMLTARINSFVS